MKQLLIIVFILFSLNGFSQKDTGKVYTIKLTEQEINILYSTLEFVKGALPTSEAKARDVSDAVKNINDVEDKIKKEYQAKNPPKK